MYNHYNVYVEWLSVNILYLYIHHCILCFQSHCLEVVNTLWDSLLL